MSQLPVPTQPGGSLSGSSYRPDVDGLRALAVGAVIINHFEAGLLPGGYLGVDIFFVISGFVITASLSRHSARNLGDLLADFYARRVRRILPALVVMVVLSGIAISLVDPNPGTSLITGIAALFGLSNVYLLWRLTDYFSASADLNIFLHTWSLGVEEQFYLLFPFLVWCSGLCGKRPGSGRRLLLILMPLLVASLVAFVVLYPRAQPQAYFLVTSRFWEMASGCLVFLAARSGRFAGLSPRFGLLALIGLLATFLAPLSLAVPATIGCVGLTGVLILVTTKYSYAYKFLSLPPLVGTGLISYSLYLWHWPVLVMSRWSVGITPWTVPFQLLLIFLLAKISFHAIETPLRKGKWLGGRALSLAFAAIASAASASFLILLGSFLADRLFLGRRNEIQDRFTSLAGSSAAICNLFSDPRSVREFAQRCGRDPSPGKPTIYLYGDSQIEQFAPALSSLASQIGYGFRGVWGNACPFPSLGAMSAEDEATRSRCLQGQRQVEARALQVVQPGDVVFMGSYLTAYFNPAKPLVQGDLQAARTAYVEATLASAEAFVARGASVVIYLNAPRFPGLEGTIEGYCTPQWFRPQLDPNCSVEARPFLLNRRQDFAALYQWADGKHRILWDGVDRSTCSDQTCGATHYKDEAHFRPYYANYIAHLFRRQNQGLFRPMPPGSFTHPLRLTP